MQQTVMVSDTLSHNFAECIKSRLMIGSTEYWNICSGAESTVPWGPGDWLLFVLFGGLLLAATVGITLMLVAAFDLGDFD